MECRQHFFGLALTQPFTSLGRVNGTGRKGHHPNTAIVTSSFTGATVSVSSWSADITVSPLAAGEQVRPVTDPSPYTPPTTETPSPTVSESTTRQRRRQRLGQAHRRLRLQQARALLKSRRRPRRPQSQNLHTPIGLAVGGAAPDCCDRRCLGDASPPSRIKTHPSC